MNYLEYKDTFIKEVDGILEFDVKEIVDSLNSAKIEFKRVVVAGNGGSFATALHFSQDLIKACDVESIVLGSNPSGLTAFANDDGYKNALVNEYKVIEKSDDMFFLLSVSGNSKNLINLAESVNGDHTVVALLGFVGGKLRSSCHSSIIVPSENFGIVESVHSYLCHFLVQCLHEPI